MMQTQVDKVMNLFRMYDLFPRDFEFVRLTAVPVIEAELSAFLCDMNRSMSLYRHVTLSKFQHALLTGFRQLQARSELHLVENLRVELPTESGPAQVKMVWGFRCGDQDNTHEMNIDFSLSRSACDSILNIRYGIIREQTELLKKHAKEIS